MSNLKIKQVSSYDSYDELYIEGTPVEHKHYLCFDDGTYIVKTDDYNIFVGDLLYISYYYDIEITLRNGTQYIFHRPCKLKCVYKIEPYIFQLQAIQYGVYFHDKWLLLDPPGLGKTATIIHIAEELYASGQLKHCLVICGINTLKENWRKEIQKHCDLSCRVLGQRKKRDGTYIVDGVSSRIQQLSEKLDEVFIITNIETIRNNDIVELIENGPNNFDLIVCDEIHQVKNSSSQQGKNFLKLKKHKRKIGATGTLLMNTPLDSYVPLSWIDVERSTVTNFKYFYCRFNGTNLIGYKHLDQLREMINDNSLRRPKSLLNLPPLNIITERLEMEGKQKNFYEEVKSGIRSQVDKVNLSKNNVLAMVSRLRQATSCPSVLTTHDIPSAKIDRCCDLVDQIISGGEKVLIFSSFKDTVYTLQEKLKKYKPLVCTGDVNDEVISRNVDEFQQHSDSMCFIATWQKCGTGITLTAATYVIFVDCSWVHANNEQAYGRAWRIGSNKPVTVYFLVTSDTIDEQVLLANQRKEAISEYVNDEICDMSEDTYKVLRKYILDL